MGRNAQSVELFKKLMRAGAGFTNYNFREYTLRRVRQGFRENIGVSDATEITKLVHEGQMQLEVVRRQALISQLYPEARHVMESAPK